ncbi:MAG: hypothetical protein GF393_05450 [Armatimonadia bacterium]|nr:hypothetical protein [Armatimonadia bacterium]
MKRMLLVAMVLAGVAVTCSAGEINLRFEGPAQDAAESLTAQTGIRINVHAFRDDEVKLDLQGATLYEAVVELGRQLGAIHRWFAGEAIHFDQGDRALDPRPSGRTTALDAAEDAEYIVFVDRVQKAHTESVEFRPGAPEPERRDEMSLRLTLMLEPVTLAARRHLRGLLPDCWATLDTGAVLLPPEEMRASAGWASHAIGHGNMGTLVLELPPEDAESIAGLTGKLMVWDEVLEETVAFTAAEEGVTKTVVGTEATLESWDRLGGEVRVTFSLPPRNGGERESWQFEGRLVGPGEEVAVFSTRSISGGTDGWRVALSGAHPSKEPDRVEFTVTVRSGEGLPVEFTINDIPLP